MNMLLTIILGVKKATQALRATLVVLNLTAVWLTSLLLSSETHYQQNVIWDIAYSIFLLEYDLSPLPEVKSPYC